MLTLTYFTAMKSRKMRSKPSQTLTGLAFLHDTQVLSLAREQLFTRARITFFIWRGRRYTLPLPTPSRPLLSDVCVKPPDVIHGEEGVLTRNGPARYTSSR